MYKQLSTVLALLVCSVTSFLKDLHSYFIIHMRTQPASVSVVPASSGCELAAGCLQLAAKRQTLCLLQRL
jgi:hypothetical protein